MNTIERYEALTVEEKAYLTFVDCYCKFKMPYILKVGDRIDLSNCLIPNSICNLLLPEKFRDSFFRDSFYCKDPDGLLSYDNGVISVNEDKVTDTDFEKRIQVYFYNKFDTDVIRGLDDVVITNKELVEFIPLQEKDGMLSVMVINPMQHDTIVNDYMYAFYSNCEHVTSSRVQTVPDIERRVVNYPYIEEKGINYSFFGEKNFLVTAVKGLLVKANEHNIIHFSLENVPKKPSIMSYLFVYADKDSASNVSEFHKPWTM